jgi:hypothetical protein
LPTLRPGGAIAPRTTRVPSVLVRRRPASRNWSTVQDQVNFWEGSRPASLKWSVLKAMTFIEGPSKGMP